MSWRTSYSKTFKKTLIVLAVLPYIANGICLMISQGQQTYGNCGGFYYDGQLGSHTQCLESCIINYWCQGVAYNNMTSACIRFTCRQYQTTPNHFEFYSLQCTESGDFAFQLKGYPITVFTIASQIGGCDPFEVTPQDSANECKELCSVNNDCRGVVYDVSTTECSMYLCSQTIRNESLTSSYYKKWIEYPICSYKDFGLGTIGDCDYLTSPIPVTSIEDCMTICDVYSAAEYCRGLTFKNNTRICGLHSCHQYKNSTTGYHFLLRECPISHTDNENVCPWEAITTTSEDHCMRYDTYIGSLEHCFASCDSVNWCKGVKYLPYPQLCSRYPCSDIPHLTNGFYARRCTDKSTVSVNAHSEQVSTSREDQTALTTGDTVTFQTDVTSKTEVTSKTKLTSKTEVQTDVTSQTDVTFQEPYCTCPCQWSTNETFQAFYVRVVEPLKVNRKSLSSSTRKLISADDNRVSAVQVGSCGVVVLVLAIAIIALCDISSFNDRRRKTHNRQL